MKAVAVLGVMMMMLVPNDSLTQQQRPVNDTLEWLPCGELSPVLRYPCRCALTTATTSGDEQQLSMDCDGATFPEMDDEENGGEDHRHPHLPAGTPLVSWSGRHAGHRRLPVHLFFSAALRRIELSDNLLTAVGGWALRPVGDTLQELGLADNLLGDALNPIFSGAGLRDLGQLRRLDLSGNRIRALEPGLLGGCPHLDTLLLDRNELEAVPGGALVGPRALEHLSLRSCRLTAVRRRDLRPADGVSHLRTLDLSDNDIATLEGGALDSLSELRELRLGQNRLTRLAADTVPFGALHLLDLSGNLLTEMPGREALAGRGSRLRHLNISANLIASVEASRLEHTPELLVLDLSRNRIANVAPGTFLHVRRLRHLSLAVNALRAVEDDAFEGLDALETLSLEDNNVLVVPGAALGRLTRIATLDLARNRLAAVSGDLLRPVAETVETLSLAGNLVRDLPPDTFVRFRALLRLDLSDNQLRSLPSAALGGDGPRETLLELVLARNRLEGTLPVLDLPRLSRLDVSRNALTEVSGASLSRLPQLRLLDMSDNPRVAVLPSDLLLPGAPLLESWSASGCSLRALPPGLLNALSHLRRVDLSRNALSELATATFAGVPRLADVDLSSNRLVTLRPRAFADATSLRRLSLAGNRLERFGGEPFNTGTGLERLDLSDNRLAYLDATSFRIHPRLRELMLAGNALASVPADLVAGLQYLERLDLARNRLHRLDEAHFARLPRLRHLSLSENPLPESLVEVGPFLHNATQLRTLEMRACGLRRLGERTLHAGTSRLDLLDLSDNRLDRLPDAGASSSSPAPLRHVRRIRLAGNAFQEAPLAALRRLAAAVDSIDLSRNRLRRLPDGDPLLVGARDLDLSDNPLEAATIATFLTEPKAVRTLRLSGLADLTALPPRLETPFLRELNVSRNNLTRLSASTFARCTLLETLDVSDNALDELTLWRNETTEYDDTVPRLGSLLASRNPVRELRAGDLRRGTSALRQLDISGWERCVRLEADAFATLGGSLRTLRAHGYPRLGYLDLRSVVRRLPALRRLDVETKDPNLTADQLGPALRPRLVELSVRGARLTTVSAGVLVGLKAPRLAVRLRDTSLETVPAGLLLPVPRSSALELDLGGSRLSGVPAPLLAALAERTDVKLLGMATNPIRCDCGTRALRRWLPYLTPTPGEMVRCATPARLAGVPLASLAERDLTCEEEIVMGVTVGGAANPPTHAVARKPTATSTAEPEIIWSLAPTRTRTRPAAPSVVAAAAGVGITPAVATNGNNVAAATVTTDDTLIIGIVGGVVAFIALLIGAMCLVRARTSSHQYQGGPLAAPASLMTGTAAGCACHHLPKSAAAYYAATLPHNKTAAAVGMMQPPPVRQAYSTMGRLPPYHPQQKQQQPYFVAVHPEEKQLSAMTAFR